MKQILHIMSSPRGKESISIQLGNLMIEELETTFPGSVVTTVDLNVNPYPHLHEKQINAMFSQEELSAGQKQLLQRSDQAIAQLMNTDIIVISLPLYNFGIPSTLKSWVDNVVRAGQTFSYTSDGPVGLVTGKKMYIALASGAVFSEGPFQPYDFAVPYLKSVLGFIGITDVAVVRAEGTSISGLMEHSLEKAIESFVV